MNMEHVKFGMMVEQYMQTYLKSHKLDDYDDTRARTEVQLREYETYLSFEITKEIADTEVTIPLTIQEMRNLKDVLELAITRYSISEALRRDLERGME